MNNNTINIRNDNFATKEFEYRNSVAPATILLFLNVLNVAFNCPFASPNADPIAFAGFNDPQEDLLPVVVVMLVDSLSIYILI